MADGDGIARGTRGLNIVVLGVGKATKLPERDLCARYIERTIKLGRQIGISSVAVREIADMTGPTRAAQEGEKLLACRQDGLLVTLDERGAAMPSVTFADRLQGWLDAGTPTLSFALGGADGHDDRVRAEADVVMSLGPMTLPHLLARVILLEQIYRAVTIRLNHPYHRA